MSGDPHPSVVPIPVPVPVPLSTQQQQDQQQEANNNNSTTPSSSSRRRRDLVLAHLSFDHDTTEETTFGDGGGDLVMPTSPSPHRHERYQGVLWKRRDIFKKSWRPRWFVLHPEQQILTYYLMNPQQHSHYYDTNSSNNSHNNAAIRHRALSEVSNISENTFDYDVVPRGTLYLRGCTVEANDSLTRPEEQLYALTITSHPNDNNNNNDNDDGGNYNNDDDQTMTSFECHLAARTLAARRLWLEQLQQAIRGEGQPNNNNNASRSIPIPPPRMTVSTREDTNSTLEDDNPSSTPSLADPSTQQLQQQQQQQQQEGVTTTNNNSGKLWKTVPNPKLLEGVPPSMQAKIEELFDTYMSSSLEKEDPSWTFQSETAEGIHCSTRNFLDSKNSLMVRAMYQTPNHHPMDYLQLMWDLERVLDFETSISSQKRLKPYNHHTLLVYTAYVRVWPTAPRDFATAVHWRIVEHSITGERALCLLAFTSPEAELLVPPRDDHVRGTLNVAMHMWKHQPPPESNNGTGKGTVHTRIVSYDLNGNIPKALIEGIMQRQSSLPRIMDVYLQKNKSSQPTVSLERLDYDAVYKMLAQGSKDDSDHAAEAAATTTTTTTEAPTTTFAPLPSPKLWKESVVLLAPVVLHRIVERLCSLVAGGKAEASLIPMLTSLVFTAMCIISVRWVFFQHLLQYGTIHHRNSQETENVVGTTTCRFNVELKGILRFLKNAQDSQQQQDVELRVQHIVIRALALAIAEQPALITRSPRLPTPLHWLFLFPTNNNNSDIFNMDFVLHDETFTPALWIPCAHQRSIAGIANYLSQYRFNPCWQNHVLGPSCRIWMTPNSDQYSQVDLDLVTEQDAPIVMVVSGVRLDPTKTPQNNSSDDKTTPLSISMTMRSSNVEACRRLSEKVQRLMQFPEMCND